MIIKYNNTTTLKHQIAKNSTKVDERIIAEVRMEARMVRIRLFWWIGGRIARDIRRPEMRLQRADIVLRKLERDRSRRKKVKKAMMQAMVERIGPNL